MTALRLGIPKGSLQDATVDLFRRAGYALDVSSRSYYPQIDDPSLSCLMLRAQEMPRYVEDGVIDVGLCGHDWVIENNADVQEVCELEYSKATANPIRWVLAVPEESAVQTPEDLANTIIVTELKETVKRYFAERKVPVKVEFSWGATEVKARLEKVGAIVDCTETGSSLRANKLRVLDTLLTSTTRLIANRQTWADDAKRQKIEDLALLLRGAIAARGRVGLKMNAPKDALPAIDALLAPALNKGQSPTVSNLEDAAWVAVEVIVDQVKERDLVPALHRAGATAIFSYPLNKVIG